MGYNSTTRNNTVTKYLIGDSLVVLIGTTNLIAHSYFVTVLCVHVMEL